VVSTKDKGEEAANQADQLREFCKKQSWPIVSEYEDHDSGSKADRTQLQAMMADCARRRLDVVVFRALDRLTREVHWKRCNTSTGSEATALAFDPSPNHTSILAEFSRMLSSRSLGRSQNRKEFGYRSEYALG
jgi:hypothetical protein